MSFESALPFRQSPKNSLTSFPHTRSLGSFSIRAIVKGNGIQQQLVLYVKAQERIASQYNSFHNWLMSALCHESTNSKRLTGHEL